MAQQYHVQTATLEGHRRVWVASGSPHRHSEAEAIEDFEQLEAANPGKLYRVVPIECCHRGDDLHGFHPDGRGMAHLRGRQFKLKSHVPD